MKITKRGIKYGIIFGLIAVFYQIIAHLIYISLPPSESYFWYSMIGYPIYPLFLIEEVIIYQFIFPIIMNFISIFIKESNEIAGVIITIIDYFSLFIGYFIWGYLIGWIVEKKNTKHTSL